MSVSRRGLSMVSTVERIRVALHEDPLEIPKEGEEKYKKCIEIIQRHQQVEELPKVKYQKSFGLVNISDACKMLFCCSHCKCCVKEVNHVIVADVKSGSFVLSQKNLEEKPSELENEMTNLMFFLHLYKEYGDLLSFLMIRAINYLPEEPKAYWETWDPTSTELLDAARVITFKKLLVDAYKVYEYTRLELMKKNMAQEMGLLTKSSPKMREQSFRQTLSKVSLSETKYVIREEHEEAFSKEKLIKDLLKITKASKAEAKRIVDLVFDRLDTRVTPQDIWDTLHDVLAQEGIVLKDLSHTDVAELLEQLANESGLQSARDLNPDDFTRLLRAKKEGKLFAMPKFKKEKKGNTKTAEPSKTPSRVVMVSDV